MKVETLIDKTAALFLFLTFPLVMSGGVALGNITERTTETAIYAAHLSVIAGFACFMLGVLLVLTFAIVPRRWYEKEIRRPRISVEW